LTFAILINYSAEKNRTCPPGYNIVHKLPLKSRLKDSKF
jgi:hypothetical protein